jgi:hypothetical protein
MEKHPVEADLGDLVDGVERLPHPLELKRRAIEGLHGGDSISPLLPGKTI